jgi:hypothetical protein
MILRSLVLSVRTWFSALFSSGRTSLKPGDDDLLIVNSAIFPLIALGLVAIIAIHFGMPLGSILLWMMACLAVGAGIGFLFGIPRAGSNNPPSARASNQTAALTSTAATDDYQGRPNTNLEEVSDWLTKIIVG